MKTYRYTGTKTIVSHLSQANVSSLIAALGAALGTLPPKRRLQPDEHWSHLEDPDTHYTRLAWEGMRRILRRRPTRRDR